MEFFKEFVEFSKYSFLRNLEGPVNFVKSLCQIWYFLRSSCPVLFEQCLMRVYNQPRVLVEIYDGLSPRSSMPFFNVFR